jgi:hypothetical protein
VFREQILTPLVLALAFVALVMACYWNRLDMGWQSTVACALVIICSATVWIRKSGLMWISSALTLLSCFWWLIQI